MLSDIFEHERLLNVQFASFCSMEALKITIAGIWVFAVPGSSIAGGQWAAGDEPLYYIVSPKDVVVAKPRFFLFSKIC